MDTRLLAFTQVDSVVDILVQLNVETTGLRGLLRRSG